MKQTEQKTHAQRERERRGSREEQLASKAIDKVLKADKMARIEEDKSYAKELQKNYHRKEAGRCVIL